MLATALYDNSFSMPQAVVSEIHRSKISLHHAKTGYQYPTVRLPYQFSALAGLPTRIYQTIHKGTLAFLVVIAPTDASDDSGRACKNDSAISKTSAFTRRRSPVRIRPSPLVFRVHWSIRLYFGHKSPSSTCSTDLFDLANLAKWGTTKNPLTPSVSVS